MSLRAPHYIVVPFALAEGFLCDLGEFSLAVGARVLYRRPFADAFDAEDVRTAVYEGLPAYNVVCTNVAGEVSRLVHGAK